jgi:hypothetical protein
MKTIQFSVLESLQVHVCQILLRIGTNPKISISRAEPIIGHGDCVQISFTPPSEHTFTEVRKWLASLEEVQQVFRIELRDIITD